MGDPRLVCTIRRLRGAAGVSQADLAQQVGVSRQALVAIEAGRQNPSTLLALRLAAALGCAVEELFAVEGARTLRAAAAGPLPKERGRVVLGRVDGRWVAHPLSDPSRPGDATIQGPGGEEVLVDTVGEAAAALEHNVLVAGCAPLLGVLAGRVARRYRDACATWVPANSERALDLLEAGMVHVAGLHLVESTDPRGHRAIAARRFPKSTITIVNLAVWRQGLAVARGNPLRIAAPGDVWRHKARFCSPRARRRSARTCAARPGSRKNSATPGWARCLEPRRSRPPRSVGRCGYRDHNRISCACGGAGLCPASRRALRSARSAGAARQPRGRTRVGLGGPVSVPRRSCPSPRVRPVHGGPRRDRAAAETIVMPSDWWVAVVAPVVLAVGCREPAGGTAHLSVFAASSLADAFADIESQFEDSHAAIDLRGTYAGSQILRLQIEQGAAADVFASANPEHMRRLVESGAIAQSHTFAYGELVVIVPLDNPAGIERFEDLHRARHIVVGSENVPVGAYTREMLERARPELGPAFVDAVLARVASDEPNVRLVRAKVELGEADAAIVYRSDANSSDQVRTVAIPAALNVRARYVVGRVSTAHNHDAATALVDFLRGPEVRPLLETPRLFGGGEVMKQVEPLVRVGGAAFAVGLTILLVVPVLGLAASASPDALRGGVEHPLFAPALWLSLRTTAVSLLVTVVAGLPLAWWLAVSSSRAVRWVEVAVQVPIVIPPAVVGVALLQTFGRQGMLGPWLGAVGISLPFSEAAVVFAQVIVSAPFFVQAGANAFRKVDRNLGDVARTLGATRLGVFRRVALPIARRGLIVGASLSWARSLGEFGATLLFAGSLTGRTQTMPLAIFAALETDVQVAVALSLVLAAAGALLLLGMRALGGSEVHGRDLAS